MKTVYSCNDLEETVQKRWAMIADVPVQLVAIEAGSIKTMMKECPAKLRAATFRTLIKGIATSHRMHSTEWRSKCVFGCREARDSMIHYW